MKLNFKPKEFLMAIKYFHYSEKKKILLPFLFYIHSEFQKAYDYSYYLKTIESDNGLLNIFFNIIENFTKEKHKEISFKGLIEEIEKIKMYSDDNRASNSQKIDENRNYFPKKSLDSLAYTYKVILHS
jgi:hypothetical protein